MNTTELQQTIARVTGITPKRSKINCDRVWYDYLDKNNLTVSDNSPYSISDTSKEYEIDGVLCWYDLYVLNSEYTEFLIIRAHDGGNVGYGQKVSGHSTDIYALFEYYYK
jgi:hypothetical protein